MTALCDSIKKALITDYPGITEVSVVDDSETGTEAGAVASLMGDLSMSSLSAIFEKESVLMVKHDFEPVFVMVRGWQFSSTLSIIKTVRQMLAAYERPARFSAIKLPVDIVKESFSRWERSIGLLFGKRFASSIIASVVGEKDLSSFTVEDLERARTGLIGVTGGCLCLTMPPACSFERK